MAAPGGFCTPQLLGGTWGWSGVLPPRGRHSIAALALLLRDNHNSSGPGVGCRQSTPRSPELEDILQVGFTMRCPHRACRECAHSHTSLSAVSSATLSPGNADRVPCLGSIHHVPTCCCAPLASLCHTPSRRDTCTAVTEPGGGGPRSPQCIEPTLFPSPFFGAAEAGRTTLISNKPHRKQHSLREFYSLFKQEKAPFQPGSPSTALAGGGGVEKNRGGDACVPPSPPLPPPSARPPRRKPGNRLAAAGRRRGRRGVNRGGGIPGREV